MVIQKLNAEGRLEKKETKKGNSMFDKVRTKRDILNLFVPVEAVSGSFEFYMLVVMLLV